MKFDSYIKIEPWRVIDACDQHLTILNGKEHEEYNELIKKKYMHVKRRFRKDIHRTQEQAIKFIKETRAESYWRWPYTIYEDFKWDWEDKRKPYESLKRLALSSDSDMMYLSHTDHKLIREYL